MAVTDLFGRLGELTGGSQQSQGAPSPLALLGSGGAAGRYDFSGMFGNVPTLMGAQKWSGGGNSIDVFTPKDATIYAPFDGIVQTMQTMNGPVPGTLVMLTDPQTGFSMRLVHTQALTQGGTIRKGQPLARVNDPGMDMLRWPGGQFGNAPGGYQHAQVDFAGSPGGFTDGPMGGQYDARQILTQGGFRPTQQVPRTPGPPEGMGGGMGMPGMGMGPMGMPGLPGMGMQGPGGMFGAGMPGLPGMGMPGMPGMGMPGMSMPGMPPMMMPPMMPGGMFGGPMGMGVGGPPGGMGMPSLPMLPPFLSGGLGPAGGPGVGGGIYGGGPPGTGAAGPVSISPGQFPGPFPPMLPFGAGMPGGFGGGPFALGRLF